MSYSDFFKKMDGSSDSTENKVTVYYYPVERQSIETRSEDGINLLIDYLKSMTINSISKRHLYRVNLTISGYDNDSRNLYEIAEVCNWARYCIQKIPYFLYFLERRFLPAFSAWLLGPMTAKQANSMQTTSDFQAKQMEFFASSSIYASNFINSLGGNDELFLLFSMQK